MQSTAYGRVIEIGRQIVKPTDRMYRLRFRMTLKKWLLYHHKNIVFGRCSWMGVPVYKNALDCWIYQEIVHEVRPEVVVELGSAAGGSTLYLAHLLDLLGSGHVISVDVDRSHFGVVPDRILAVTGRSDDQEVVNRVAQLCRGKRTG